MGIVDQVVEVEAGPGVGAAEVVGRQVDGSGEASEETALLTALPRQGPT
jgi:hypothetical protein